MDKAIGFMVLSTFVFVIAAVAWRMWKTRNIRNDV